MMSHKTSFFKRRGADNVLYFCVIWLVIFGIIMIGSASIGQTAIKGPMFAMKNFGKQAFFVTIGLCFMFFIARCFKRKWVFMQSVNLMWGVGIALMCFCVAFGNIKGSYAWIRIGPLTIQPAEFMKIIMILFCAFYFGEIEQYCQIPHNISAAQKQELQKRKVWHCLFKPGFMIIGTAVIGLLVQRDLGTTAIIGFICLVIFLITPLTYYKKFKKLLIIVLCVGGVIGIFTFSFVLKGYQMERIYTWLNPLGDINGNGWQLTNSLIAFSSGGLFGKGFMASALKYGYIPEAYNDFICAIIFEELGLVGFLLVLIPYCLIIFKMFHYGFLIKDIKSKLILYGIGTYFFAHLIVNVGGVTGFVPMTGVPLLFISAGGSSVWAALIAIGIAQSIISKYNRDVLKERM